jgi:hypothetical protein
MDRGEREKRERGIEEHRSPEDNHFNHSTIQPFNIYMSSSLRSRLTAEEIYLNRLLSFVPPSLYIPRTDQELDELHERSGLNAKFWKKESSKASIQSSLKANSKKAKRRRYEAEPETLSQQIARRAQTNNASDNDKDDEEEEAGNNQSEDEDESSSSGSSSSSSMDGLRQRLQARIDLLRKQRETDGKRGFKRNKPPADNLPTKREKRKKKNKKKATSVTAATTSTADNESDISTDDSVLPSSSASSSTSSSSSSSIHSTSISEAPYLPAVNDLQFSSLGGLANTSDVIKQNKEIQNALTASDRGGQKRKRIQKLLEEAEKKQRRMEELRKSGEGLGKSQEAWDTTLRRAAGETIKDDPKLLKKSMKRMKRKKQKSKERWAAQVESVQEAKNMKQDTRKKNLKEQNEKKKAKRMGKTFEDPIKHGNKKSSRPGFEGKIKEKIGGGSAGK